MDKDKVPQAGEIGFSVQEGVVLDIKVTPAAKASAWLWESEDQGVGQPLWYLFPSFSLPVLPFPLASLLALGSMLSRPDLKAKGLGKSSPATY